MKLFLIGLLLSCSALAVEMKDINKVVAGEFKLNKINLEMNLEEINTQEKIPGKVKFIEALRLALQSYMNDSSDSESPLALVSDRVNGEKKAKKQLFKLMNRKTTTLFITKIGESPEGGEEVSDNWIISLYLEDLSDHFHWAIIDRNGNEAVYNYGFN